MIPSVDSIFQRYYNVASYCDRQQQAPLWMVRYLREHLNDERLDIRRRKINGRFYWCVVRRSHPREVFGSFAKRGHGLPHLPVTIYHFTACEVCGSRPNSIDKCPNDQCQNYMEECKAPRSIGIMDVENWTRSPTDYQERLCAAYAREASALKRMCENHGANYAAEISPHLKPRSYGTRWMSEENERRIAAGEAN